MISTRSPKLPFISAPHHFNRIKRLSGNHDAQWWPVCTLISFYMTSLMRDLQCTGTFAGFLDRSTLHFGVRLEASHMPISRTEGVPLSRISLLSTTTVRGTERRTCHRSLIAVLTIVGCKIPHTGHSWSCNQWLWVQRVKQMTSCRNGQ
jgi:hypothetical protein